MGGGEGFAEGVVFVEELAAEAEAGGGAVDVEGSGAPPGGGGRGRRRRSDREGEEEVGDDGALGGGEAAVPEEINGEVTGEEGAFVVLKDQGLLLDLDKLSGGGCGGVEQEEEREGEVGHGQWCRERRQAGHGSGSKL